MHCACIDDYEKESNERSKRSIDEIGDKGLNILSGFEEFF